MRNLLINNIMVGMITEYNLFVEVHDHEQTQDEEPLYTVSVKITRYKTGHTIVSIDEEQNEDVWLSVSDKYNIVKKVEDDIKDGLIKLPHEVEFDPTDMDFIIFN